MKIIFPVLNMRTGCTDAEGYADEFQGQGNEEKLDEIHAIEHAADEKNHELMDRLARAFITPH